MNCEKIDEGLYRILIPFQNLNTTVYIYRCGQGAVIIDSATYPSDVDNYILPALDELHIPGEMIKYLLLTHHHGDHSGGFQRLIACFPDAVAATSFPVDAPNYMALEDGKKILGNLHAVHLPGHTENAFGFMDTETGTLLSGDCLQQDGVDIYRKGIGNFQSYISSVDKLKQMHINRIVASHEYDPLGSVAQGQEAVAKYLNMCIEIALRKQKK